jgi:glutathione synthase/RimK-type ligase-like ATP-grasp enzyme
VIVTDYLDPQIALPPHQLIFNAIGDADLCKPALEAAIRLIDQTTAPVINDPRAVMKTGRTDNAVRLGVLPGVVTPKTIPIERDLLAGSGGSISVADLGFSFPLLLRSPGYHTGRNFSFVEKASELAAAAADLPGDELLVIEYLDARGGDGNARKYRVMMIGGRIYPLHLAISRNWKVHYFTSDMADKPDHRAEEALFLADMRAALGDKAMSALEQIRDELGLDYAGVDFGLASNGDLLLFEANATMVIAVPDADERWAYRRTASSSRGRDDRTEIHRDATMSTTLTDCLRSRRDRHFRLCVSCHNGCFTDRTGRNEACRGRQFLARRSRRRHLVRYGRE